MTNEDSSGHLEATVKAMAKIGRSFSPSFSPDGSRIAFVSDLSGIPQVWIVDRAGGWPEMITNFDDQVSSVTWSPQGDQLAVSVAPGGGMNSQILLLHPDGSGAEIITEGGSTNNWLGRFTHDGNHLWFSSNARSPESVEPYLFSIQGWKACPLSEGRGLVQVTDISRDGKYAVMLRAEERGNSNLSLLEIDSGEEKPLTSHDGKAEFGAGRFSPDAGVIYLTSNKDREFSAFCRIQLHGGAPGDIEVLVEREGTELEGVAMRDDGALAALAWNVGGRSEIEFVDLQLMKTRPGPSLAPEIGGIWTFSRDGRFAAVVASGARHPLDIWTIDLTTNEVIQLTHTPHAGVNLDDLVAPELLTYQAHDGLGLSGWLYRPANGTPPYPVVLSFHGGPEGQERPILNSTYQALLSQGIGVFAPNIRGSSGFGKTFVNLDNGRLRFDAVKDIEASIRFIVSSGVGASGRLGIMGGSYGGFMVTAGLTEYPNLLTAGATICGMVNFETFFANTEPWMAEISKSEYGDPDLDPTLFKELSPIHKIDRIKSPTIVLHGANDTNVPVIEAEQVVENLRSRNVPVEYVLFPDEGHGFTKTANRTAATLAMVRWFKTYL